MEGGSGAAGRAAGWGRESWKRDSNQSRRADPRPRADSGCRKRKESWPAKLAVIEHTYKKSPFRSVVRIESGSEVWVEKRFHHPSFLRALRDRSRARAELRALASCAALGLPVPELRSSGIESARPGFSMQCIRGARSLEELLYAGDAPGGWPALMRRLGSLQARMHQLGVEPRDSHPGNVLVDPTGQPWLVDLRGTRFRRGPSCALKQRASLVLACAQTRDFLPTRMQLAFLAAWQRSMGRRTPWELSRIEAEACSQRRSFVEHGAGRWVRRSSRCEELHRPGEVRFRAKLDPDFASGPLPTAEPSLTLEGPLASVRASWLASARCVEHRLPVAWPLELQLCGKQARASFAAACSPGLALPDDGAQSLQALRQRFHGRGLEPADWQAKHLVKAKCGGFLLRPPVGLMHSQHHGAH